MTGIVFKGAKPRASSIRAVVTRADGSVVDYGLVAYHHWITPVKWIVNRYIELRRWWRGLH